MNFTNCFSDVDIDFILIMYFLGICIRSSTTGAWTCTLRSHSLQFERLRKNRVAWERSKTQAFVNNSQQRVLGVAHDATSFFLSSTSTERPRIMRGLMQGLRVYSRIQDEEREFESSSAATGSSMKTKPPCKPRFKLKKGDLRGILDAPLDVVLEVNLFLLVFILVLMTNL